MHQKNRKMNILKITFYEELETIVTGYPKNHIKIPLGEFYAKVAFEEQDSSAVGNCGLHEERNANGLACALDTVFGTVTFPHKKIHFATWRFPDGTINNQSDHILIAARHTNNMME